MCIRHHTLRSVLDSDRVSHPSLLGWERGKLIYLDRLPDCLDSEALNSPKDH